MKQVKQNTMNFLVDAAMFVVFLIATAPRLSGLAIHEWLSLTLAAAIVTHLLLHWQWIIGVGKRLFAKKTTWRSRLNYLLNVLLFVAFTVTIATGILISQEALPLFGLTMTSDRSLKLLHHQASDLTVLLLGLHVAIHWSWIVGMFRRFLPQRRPLHQPAVARNDLEEVSR